MGLCPDGHALLTTHNGRVPAFENEGFLKPAHFFYGGFKAHFLRVISGGEISRHSHCRSRRDRQETSLPVGKSQEVWGQCRDVGRSHLQQQQNAGETCR